MQGFPYCERGVMRSVRFGGLLYLKGFDLPDQAQRSRDPMAPTLDLLSTCGPGPASSLGSPTRET